MSPRYSGPSTEAIHVFEEFVESGFGPPPVPFGVFTEEEPTGTIQLNTLHDPVDITTVDGIRSRVPGVARVELVYAVPDREPMVYDWFDDEWLLRGTLRAETAEIRRSLREVGMELEAAVQAAIARRVR